MAGGLNFVPGDIIEAYFVNENGVGGKVRPCLILQVDNNISIALALKVTKKARHNRVPLYNWRLSGLVYPSHAQYDNAQAIPLTGKEKLIGKAHPSDFKRVVDHFHSSHP
jgi:hypothetical protein